MSARMQVPLSQRRHTNIAVVRYAKNGIKLEIACYKNKVISYRSGVETRLDEVLQVERVFTNVSRGLYASEKEIQTVFNKKISEQEALKYILEHGELQVAQQERAAEVDQMFIDIATIISQKCVNEVTQRPFPSQVIEQALRSIGAAVKLDQPVKKQALAFIHQLIEAQIIPIARARMKLRCIAPDNNALTQLIEWCHANGAIIENNSNNNNNNVIEASSEIEISHPHQHSLLILLQPHLFREIEKFVKSELPPGGSVHMVESAAMDIGEADVMDAELIARANAHANINANLNINEKEGGGGTSRRTGSSEHLLGNDNNRNSGKKSKRGGGKNKQQQQQQQRGEYNERDQHSNSHNTELLSSTPARNNEEEEDSNNSGDELRAALSKLGLEKMEISGKNKNNNNINSSDEDDGKGKRGKKKSKRRQGGGQQQQQQKEKEKEKEEIEEEGSDEEVLVNRKQRKHAAAAAKVKGGETNYDWDAEDEFDYGYDEEEKENGM